MMTFEKKRDGFLGPEPKDRPENHCYWRGRREGYTAGYIEGFTDPIIKALIDSILYEDHPKMVRSLDSYAAKLKEIKG